MKAPLLVIALVAVSLAILAVAVFALDDETLFVSAPETVADELLHATSLGRVEPLRLLLSRDARRATPPADVRSIVKAFRERVGPVRRTEGKVVERRGDTAVVRVSVDGDRAKPELLVRLVREEGVWSAAHLEDVLPAESGTAKRGRR